MTRSDQYVLANAEGDDVMMKNVTTEEESMIQRLSERHVAVIIVTISALTLIMLIIAVIIFVRRRRCESCLNFSSTKTSYDCLYRSLFMSAVLTVIIFLVFTGRQR